MSGTNESQYPCGFDEESAEWRTLADAQAAVEEVTPSVLRDMAEELEKSAAEQVRITRELGDAADLAINALRHKYVVDRRWLYAGAAACAGLGAFLMHDFLRGRD